VENYDIDLWRRVLSVDLDGSSTACAWSWHAYPVDGGFTAA
jgi:hypothetical protein